MFIVAVQTDVVSPELQRRKPRAPVTYGDKRPLREIRYPPFCMQVAVLTGPGEAMPELVVLHPRAGRSCRRSRRCWRGTSLAE